MVYNQNWCQETESSPSYEVNDGFHLFEIHSLPEKMLWPEMILYGIFILILEWKMTQEPCPLAPREQKSQEKKTPSETEGKAKKTPPITGIGTLIGGRPIPPHMGQR